MLTGLRVHRVVHSEDHHSDLRILEHFLLYNPISNETRMYSVLSHPR